MSDPNVMKVLLNVDVGPTAFDALMGAMRELNNRQTRTESRLVKLMQYHGLDEYGDSKRKTNPDARETSKETTNAG